jgi:hypothetical protein
MPCTGRTLAKIDPATGAVVQTLKVPAGSYNPCFSGGRIWVTRAEGAIALGTPGHGAIWLTDYHAGTIARIPLRQVLARCGPQGSMHDE